MFESGFKTTLAIKLNAADSTMTVATAPTITNGRVFIDNGAQQEWISFTGVSGKILTGLTRNLSTTAIPVTGGTGKSWIAGTIIKIVAMHDQLRDGTKTETITGIKTFTGNNIHNGTETFNGIVNMGALGDLNVLGTSNPSPVVADDTARDALYTSPLANDRCYNVAAQAEQVYNGGAWDTYGISTPTPNASETVAGKVEIATTAELNYGPNTGGTGAYIVPHAGLFSQYGDGSDGDVTISGTVTLARDMYYNNLDIPVGQILNPNGYKVYVAGTLSGAGKIQRNGNNGSNGGTGTLGAGGVVLNAGTLAADIAGGDGGTGGANGGTPNPVVGTAGASNNPSYSTINGVAGGDGGAGAADVGATGGAGGTSTRGVFYNTVNNTSTIIQSLMFPASNTLVGFVATKYKGISGSGGGGGGGGGGGSDGGGGGGGGGNGGIIRVAAKNITFTGVRESKGGNGGNGGSVGGNAGGGGGGGGGNGGVVIIIFTTDAAGWTSDVTGGTKGVKGTGVFANGVDGTDGNAGVVIQIDL